MLIAASARITSPSTAVISLVRSGVRSDSRLNLADRRGRGFRWLFDSSRWLDSVSCAVMTSPPYDDGSRSTYPTPRRVWISRGSLVSIFRRSTDT